MKRLYPRLSALALSVLLLAGCGSDRPSGDTTDPDPVPVTVTLDADALTGEAGSVFTLAWESAGADACTASGAWSGTRPTHGSEAVTPEAGTHEYRMECAGPGGSAGDTVTIVVTDAPDPFAESKAEYDRLRELEARTESASP